MDVAARDALRWDTPGPADTLSTVGAFGLPLLAVGGAFLRGGPKEQGFADALYVAEALALDGLVNQAVKFTVARERPNAWARDKTLLVVNPDDDLSFYSLHTSLAFAAVSAAGTVALLRGDRAAPWVWGVGIPLAATVGYLRVAADEHWLSDVGVGALLGTASGVLTPLLLHPRVAPSPAGAAPVAGAWTFTVVPGPAPFVQVEAMF